jgi:Putative lumazine-binding
MLPNGRSGRAFGRSVPELWSAGEARRIMCQSSVECFHLQHPNVMRRFTIILATLTASAFATHRAAAQTAADTTGIRATALDYIEGWYAGDGARMERSLHPELAKRNVTSDPASGRSRLIQMSALTLINGTRSGGGSQIPAAQRKNDVKILDIYHGAASVRVTAASWVDYMHMSKVNGRWVIMNVLWENDPAPTQ